MFTPRLLVVLSVLFFSAAALAAPKISLVTISPGPMVFESFGHTVILVEDGAVSPSVDPSAPSIPLVTMYEYGTINQKKLFASRNLMNAFSMLFNSKVKTRVGKFSSTIDPVTGLPAELVKRYFSPNSGLREITVDPLQFTNEQADNFVLVLEADVAAGEYNYENFTRNCATGPRDRILNDTIIGKEVRAVFDNKVDLSLDQIAKDSFDEAVANSATKSVKLLDDAFAKSSAGKQALMMLSFMEIQPEYTTSKDFYETLKRADVSLGEGKDDSNPMAQGFHKFFFAPELTEKPIAEWRTLYTPKRVRAAVLRTLNSATGKPLIDITQEIKRNNAAQPVDSTKPAANN